MIKNIVFDLGNVIIHWDPKYIISQHTNDPLVQEELLDKIFGSPHWLAFDNGSLSREEVIHNIQKTVSFKYRSLIADIVYYWYQHCPEIEGMGDLIKKLKEKGHNIYLLSNTNIHFDEYKDNLSMIQCFDGFYISAKTKLVKPSPEIYLDFLKTFKLINKECLFIDDAKANIEGAKKVGMYGYQFDGDVKKLKDSILRIKVSAATV